LTGSKDFLFNFIKGSYFRKPIFEAKVKLTWEITEKRQFDRQK